MPRAISRCPGCAEPVTPFAAGCAICGYDLVAARQARAASRNPLDHISAPRLHLGDDELRLVIALLISLAAPLFGIVLASYFAWQFHNEGRMGWRAVMLGIAAANVLAMTLTVSPLFLIHALLN